MQVSDLITAERIDWNVDASSKKRALEVLSKLISDSEDTISTNDVFDSLLARERLGATGVGHGVAIPHGRLKNTQHTLGAFVKLNNAVDFDAADQKPVDLLFALLVPEESTDDHLKALASLATMFSDSGFRSKVRDATSKDEVIKLLLDWQDTHPN